MDEIRKAFQKVKEDMDALKREIEDIKLSLNVLINNFEEKQTSRQTHNPTNTFNTPTGNSLTSNTPTHNPTNNLLSDPLKSLNLNISTGNEGVPADRQTSQQTDQQTHFNFKSNPLNHQNPIQNASQLLDSLDIVKQEIRRKFKQLTNQEFLVFTTLYQLEDSQLYDVIDYSLLAQKLGLTESSIRDYVARLLKKEIPLDKSKINNKKVALSILPTFKKITSLPTLINLRDM